MSLTLTGVGQSAAQVAAQVAGMTTSSRLYTQMTPQPGDLLTATTTAEQTYASGYTLPANALMVGQALIIKGSGLYTTTAIAPPTQRARLRVQGQTAVDSGAISFPVSLSACRYTFDLHLIVRAIGVNGAVEAFGSLLFATSLTSAIPILGGPSGTVGDSGNPVSVDTTQPMPLALSCQFGGVLAGNSNSMRQITIHTLRPAS